MAVRLARRGTVVVALTAGGLAAFVAVAVPGHLQRRHRRRPRSWRWRRTRPSARCSAGRSPSTTPAASRSGGPARCSPSSSGVWAALTATRITRGEEEAGRWDLLLAGRMRLRVAGRELAGGARAGDRRGRRRGGRRAAAGGDGHDGGAAVRGGDRRHRHGRRGPRGCWPPSCCPSGGRPRASPSRVLLAGLLVAHGRRRRRRAGLGALGQPVRPAGPDGALRRRPRAARARAPGRRGRPRGDRRRPVRAARRRRGPVRRPRLRRTRRAGCSARCRPSPSTASAVRCWAGGPAGRLLPAHRAAGDVDARLPPGEPGLRPARLGGRVRPAGERRGLRRLAVLAARDPARRLRGQPDRRRRRRRDRRAARPCCSPSRSARARWAATEAGVVAVGCVVLAAVAGLATWVGRPCGRGAARPGRGAGGRAVASSRSRCSAWGGPRRPRLAAPGGARARRPARPPAATCCWSSPTRSAGRSGCAACRRSPTSPPSRPSRWTSPARSGCCAVAVLLAVVGLAGYARRDLRG